MNIIGEGFPAQINKQVIQRQKIYGSGYTQGTSRSSEEIVYLNANTSWCKLISSVNVNNPKIVQNQTIKDLNLAGEQLARKFTLFNGTFDTTDGEQKSGIDSSKSLSGHNYAYGIGGTDFGLGPMMGIKSADIKHENRGSIRRATVQIKAWNKNQFDIIDILYLRLGFNILLEWGHTMWYDNDGNLHTGSDIDNSLAENFLSGTGIATRITTVPDIPKAQSDVPYAPEIPTRTTTTTGNGPINYYEFLTLIQNKRLSSNGNYDAMFAKVVNFHWSFQKDGSYDITLDLVSIGDIVESFKINSLIGGLNSAPNVDSTDKPLSELSDDAIIELFANQHSIGQFFYESKNKSIRQTPFIQKSEKIPFLLAKDK